MSEWTVWYSIEKAKEGNGLLNQFGIYQIRIVNLSGNPLPIERFCANDAEGVIYFGRSGFKSQQTNRTTANRILEFIRYKHSGGRAYAKIKPVLDKHPRFTDHQIQVRGLILPDSKIKQAEASLLSGYLSVFGELPPCNSSQPRHQADED